jgi:hypothetical protein
MEGYRILVCRRLTRSLEGGRRSGQDFAPISSHYYMGSNFKQKCRTPARAPTSFWEMVSWSRQYFSQHLCRSDPFVDSRCKVRILCLYLTPFFQRKHVRRRHNSCSPSVRHRSVTDSIVGTSYLSMSGEPPPKSIPQQMSDGTRPSLALTHDNDDGATLVNETLSEFIYARYENCGMEAI